MTDTPTTAEGRRMNQLMTQGQLIVEDLDRQLRNIREIGDSPTAVHLGRKARNAMIAYLDSIYGSGDLFTQSHLDDRPEFYISVPIIKSKKALGEWTAHVSSLLPNGTVNREGGAS